MNIKEYFWDLSETALAETEQIVRNPTHPDFVRRIIRVLSRCDQPKEVFTLITKKQFTENWPNIRREWKRTNEASEHFSWWESVYEQLLNQKKTGNKRVKGAPAQENQEIGRKIRRAREQKGWSQTDLAHHTGLKQPDISAIEKGNKNITLATFAKLEKTLELKAVPEPTSKESEMLEGPEQGFQLDGIQKQVYEALKELAGPGAEAFYWDACWLRRNGGELQSCSHLLGHLFREIESSVRDVLRLGVEIKKATGESAHKREIEEILKQLGVSQNDLYARIWLGLADHSRLHKLAHRVDLLRPRELSEELQYEFLKFDGFLNWVLNEIRKHSSDFMKVLDELLGKENPTAGDVTRLCDKIPNTFYIRNYFFGKCRNSKWLPLLKDKGAFQYPPAPQQNEEGHIRFSAWAESGYLVRMATEAPREVMDVILLIPDTQNIYVIDDLVKATLNMPIEIALSVKEKAAKWMANEYLFYPLDGHLGELIQYYISAGKADEALELTRILLEILPDPNWQEKSKDGDFQWDGPRPRARIDNYDYREIADKIIPGLAKSTGVPVFRWLCEMLDRALSYSQARDAGTKSNNDYSQSWRPEIEKPERYEADELKNILIDLILKISMQLAATTGFNLVVTILGEKSWVVFKRMVLYLLSRQPGAARELTEKYLSDRLLFERDEYWNEYGPLLENGFGLLPSAKQSMILQWIEDGPDFKKWYKKPGAEEVEPVRQRWQRNCLARFGEALPEAWRSRYNQLVQEHGEAEKKRDHGVVVEGEWESSPKTLEELAAMTVGQLVQYINEWKPSVEARGASAEGLAQMLSALVKSNPEVYSADARQFTQLTSTYTSTYLFWVFWGFEEVLRNASPNLEWMPILEICQWIEKLSREIKEGKASGWSQTRGGIANLLGEGMRKNLIPLKFRRTVWTVLEPLTEDLDPTSDYEEINDMEPFSLSINSTRGKAMHAVMNYAWWVYRNRTEGKTVDPREGENHDMLPEIDAVLEKHLDHTQDPTLAIHSVYGRWFPWLAKVKPKWAALNRTRIFPVDESERKYWGAAWNTYIFSCQPYDDVFEILKAEYTKAVDEIESTVGKHNERLAWHLVLFYIRGRLELESDMFVNFWKRAADESRAKAMFYIGFNNSVKPLPEREMLRLKVLWENRRETVLSVPTPSVYIKEMAAFGHWFGSGKFEPQWAIQQLLFVLETTKHVEAIPSIMEQLKTMVADFPVEVVRVLKALAENEPNFIVFNQGDIKMILGNAICGQDDVGRTKAQDFCNYLISKGVFEFKNLLQMCEEQSLGK